MEPDQLKTVREKIYSMEQQPVRWQKDFVWREATKKSGIRSTPFRWYAVAAILLMGFMGIINVYYQREGWNSTASRISFLEKEIESAENKIQQSREENCLAIQPEITNSTLATTKTKRSTLAKKTPVIVEEVLTTIAIDSVHTNNILLELIVAEDVYSETKTISPIIGKIPMPNPIATANPRKKRVRINRFNGQDNIESPFAQEEAKRILARIN